MQHYNERKLQCKKSWGTNLVLFYAWSLRMRNHEIVGEKVAEKVMESALFCKHAPFNMLIIDDSSYKFDKLQIPATYTTADDGVSVIVARTAAEKYQFIIMLMY